MKTDAALQIITSLSASEEEVAAQYLSNYGFEAEGRLDIIVKYNGDIDRVAREQSAIAQIISTKFAVLSVPRQNVSALSNYTEIEYMETPKLLTYNLNKSMTGSCIKTVQNNRPYNLTGKGVILGIIDSGIQYAHRDFRNLDGTTRIISIWDQGIDGAAPYGFKIGTEYTRAQINEALTMPNAAGRLSVVPSVDTIGHGTHVAGIAGGNGNASNGQYIGAAPEAEFIIVKLGKGGTNGTFVRNIEIMLAIKYVVEKARELGMPVAINLSNGMNEGPHDGQSIIEQYVDEAAQLWKTNIVVATGNEAANQTHTQGKVYQGSVSSFSFQVAPNQYSYSLSVWKAFIDTFEFEIVSPAGTRTPKIAYSQKARTFILDKTRIYVTFVGPSPLNGDEEFALYLSGLNSAAITDGAWSINIYGKDVVNGEYYVWGPTRELAGDDTFMLEPVRFTTLTTPSTARNAISVGAYNSITNQIAPFSGVGYSRNSATIKPDLVAPGVDITATSITGGYIRYSGTSMATPHVTGAVALMMQWGIVQHNQPFLYGEFLKTYLLKGTNRNNIEVPNPEWGYGRLCVKTSLDLLIRLF
ncbi:MAG: peptidase S8 and S53 subtilisin kexin sedolisin [Epulopiscium sp. Nele67-Bin001]|nr:MAG: peptidase S8 and S53 subtilisin kexin sedolisin [Epulopiscium sp. Nele67-Bin001]